MNINERIKSRRKELGLSVDKIAEKLHISRASYYRYETKEVYNLPIDIVQPLSHILGVSPAYIMGWEDRQGNNKLAPDTTVMLELFDQLDPDDQQEIIDVIKLKLNRKKDTMSADKISV